MILLNINSIGLGKKKSGIICMELMVVVSQH